MMPCETVCVYMKNNASTSDKRCVQGRISEECGQVKMEMKVGGERNKGMNRGKVGMEKTM